MPEVTLVKPTAIEKPVEAVRPGMIAVPVITSVVAEDKLSLEVTTVTKMSVPKAALETQLATLKKRQDYFTAQATAMDPQIAEIQAKLDMFK